MRRRGVCAAPERWQNELARLGARVRVLKPIAMLESCLTDAPIVLGHLRPVILMPVGLLAGLPAGQIEAILLHELAHIRRHDYLANALQRLLEGLLFYHPAVWWISRVIRAERENCCDDAVVSVRGNAVEYAAALASLEQNRSTAGEPALAATGGSLVKRIHRLLYPENFPQLMDAVRGSSDPDRNRRRRPGRLAIGRARANALHFPSHEDWTANTPYSKWLNEDVAYIIDDAERAAFLELSSDAERDRFIEQFWARRNPTPGAAGNAFKEEHYRRIAYANSHFAAAVPGWQTDRGHMYIVWGPPDEIEAHPSSPQSPHGSEVWAYRHIESTGDKGTFTFIDRSGHGDYHLAPGNAHY